MNSSVEYPWFMKPLEFEDLEIDKHQDLKTK